MCMHQNTARVVNTNTACSENVNNKSINKKRNNIY